MPSNRGFGTVGDIQLVNLGQVERSKMKSFNDGFKQTFNKIGEGSEQIPKTNSQHMQSSNQRSFKTAIQGEGSEHPYPNPKSLSNINKSVRSDQRSGEKSVDSITKSAMGVAPQIDHEPENSQYGKTALKEYSQFNQNNLHNVFGKLNLPQNDQPNDSYQNKQRKTSNFGTIQEDDTRDASRNNQLTTQVHGTRDKSGGYGMMASESADQF